MTDAAQMPRRSRLSRYLKPALAIAIYLSISFTLASIPSDTIIDSVGGENAYLLMFALGMLGGFTTFTGIPYHLVLMSLAAGGLNPVLLGTTTAIGVMLGDSTMFLVGKNVKESLSPRMMATIEQLTGYLMKHPRLVSPVLTAYGAMSPFSNDFIVGSLSIVGYNYWRTILPLTLGNILYNIGLAYLGLYAYDAVIDWF